MKKLEYSCPKCGKILSDVKEQGFCHTCLMQTVLDFSSVSELTGKGDLPEVDGYDLLCEIGIGAMGNVYEALQHEPRRNVAIKLLHDEQIEGEGARLKFLQEVELAAKMEHPAIVPIYGAGRQGGFLFYSSRLMVGGDLSGQLGEFVPAGTAGKSDLLEKQRKVASLITRIANGLAYAHQRGIIHRDIKTSNILLDEVGLAYISDFGLASELNFSDQCRNEMVSGSPSYMAPEQLNGGEMTASIDLYALGVIFYELLTGNPPFESNSLTRLIQRICEKTPVFPKEYYHLDRTLRSICLRSIAKDPNERYQGMRELEADLNAWLLLKPTVAKPLNRSQRIALWTRREPLNTVLVILLLAIILFGAEKLWTGYVDTLKAERAALSEEKKNRYQLVDELFMRADLAGRELRYTDAVSALNRVVKLTHDSPEKQNLAQRLQSAWAKNTPTEFFHNGAEGIDLILSPNGKWLASWSLGHTCCIWKVTDNEGRSAKPTLWKTFNLENDYAVSAIFSPQSDRVLISTDRGAILYHVESGNQIQRLESSDKSSAAKITSLSRGLCRFSEDGKTVVMALQGKPVEFWRINEKGLCQYVRKVQIPENLEGVRGDIINLVVLKEQILVAWSRGWMSIRSSGVRYFPMKERLQTFVVREDGKYLSTGNKKGLIDRYHLDSLEKVSQSMHNYWVTMIDFSPDHQWMISCARDKSLRLWSIQGENITEAKRIRVASSPVTYCEWIDSESIIAVTTDNGRLKFYDASSLHLVNEQILTGGRPSKVAVSKDGKSIFIGSEHGHIASYKAPNFPEQDGSRQPAQAREIQFDEAQNRLVGIADLIPNEQSIVVRDREGKWDNWIIGKNPYSHCLSISRDGTHVVSGDAKGFVQLWDTRSGEKVFSQKWFDVAVRKTAVELVDGKLSIAAASDHEDLAVFFSGKKNVVYRSKLKGTSPILRFSLSGKELVAGMSTGEVIVFFPDSKKIHTRRLSNVHSNQVVSLEFSPDGVHLGSGDMNGIVCLHDFKSGIQKGPLLKHNNLVQAICFDNLGKTVATSDLGKRIRFFQVDTGLQIGAAHGVKQNFNDLIFRGNEIIGTTSDSRIIKIKNF